MSCCTNLFLYLSYIVMKIIFCYTNKMENISCVLKSSLYDSEYYAKRYQQKSRFKKITDYVSGATDSDIDELQRVNNRTWDRFTRRHNNIIDATLPYFLKLGSSINLIVFEDCSDPHADQTEIKRSQTQRQKRKKRKKESKTIEEVIDKSHFQFYFDVGEITKSLLISSILGLSTDREEMDLLDKVRKSIYVTIFNPVTQEPFNPSEIKFFSKVFRKEKQKFLNAEFNIPDEKKSIAEKIYDATAVRTFGLTAVNLVTPFAILQHLETTVWAINAAAFVKKTDLKHFNHSVFISAFEQTDDMPITTFKEKIAKTRHILEHRDTSSLAAMVTKIYKLWGIRHTVKTLGLRVELLQGFTSFLKFLSLTLMFFPGTVLPIAVLSAFVKVLQFAFLGNLQIMSATMLTFLAQVFGQIIPRLAQHAEKKTDIEELEQHPNTRTKSFYRGMSIALHLKNKILHTVWDRVKTHGKLTEEITIMEFEKLTKSFILKKIKPRIHNGRTLRKLRKSQDWIQLQMFQGFDDEYLHLLDEHSDFCKAKCNGATCIKTTGDHLTLCGIHNNL